MEHLISNIDGINAIENGRMIVFYKDGSTIETDSIDFNEDGTFTLGYIYQ